MTFRISFSPTDKAWVASLENSPTMSWIAASPAEALEGLMALTPVPDPIAEDDDDRDGREIYDEYLQKLTNSGTARGCACEHPGCHCDGVADVGPDYPRCGCCMVDCPEVHHSQDDQPSTLTTVPQMTSDPIADE